MENNPKSKIQEPVNYLVQKKIPERKTEEFYEKQKLQKMEFGEVWGQQSHLRRRKMILKEHPEIANLLLPTKPYSVILCLILVVLGLSACYLVKDSSWPVFILTAYFIGGTISHTMHVLIHDFTHMNGHPNVLVNKILAILCNVPVGFPSAMTFGKYHNEHHIYQGQQGKDADLPTRMEAAASKSKLVKFVFFTFYVLIYMIRPLVCMPKKMTMGEIANIIVIICTNVLIYKFWGPYAVFYLILGGYLSVGLHPASMHVIAEHFQFVKGLQTYDYIGFWNFFNLDLGYHTQHHDFPTCPWYNLRKIRATAPQYYEYLPYHTSYLEVAKKYLFDDNFNLYNRTFRLPNGKINQKKTQ